MHPEQVEMHMGEYTAVYGMVMPEALARPLCHVPYCGL